MKTSTIFLLLTGLILFQSCNIEVDYQKDSLNTGSVELIPSTPILHSFVTVNGRLVARDAAIKSIIINHLPEGEHKIHFVANSSELMNSMDVEIPVTVKRDQLQTKLVSVPPVSNGYYTWTGLFLAAIWIAPFAH